MTHVLLILVDAMRADHLGCYAGKDRTGLLALLLLLKHNIPKNIILNDYLATGPSLLRNLDYFKENWVKKGLSRDEYAERMQPKKETLIRLLAHIESQYHGIQGYLELIGYNKQLEKISGK